MSLSFSQLKTLVRTQIWPSGEPENLVSAHDLHFQEGAALIARFCEGERQQNINVIDFCKTYFKCAMTVVPAPKGQIRRLWVVCNGQNCDPVWYWPTDWPTPEAEGIRIMQSLPSPNPKGKPLPFGFSQADASNDTQCGRARNGYWAIHNGNIYIVPWIQSTESVVIEWDGMKTTWADNDPVNEEQSYIAAFKLFAQYAHERDFGDLARARAFHNPQIAVSTQAEPGYFDLALAEHIAWDRDKRHRPPVIEKITPGRVMENWTMFDQCQPPLPAVATLLAHIGNFGSGDANEAAVAQMLLSQVPPQPTPPANSPQTPPVPVLGPADIIATDPAISTVGGGTYDARVGQFYHQLLYPYGGAYGVSGVKNQFWPAPGDSDFTSDNLASYSAFFTLPNNGRYYDVCFGSVHLFVLDSSQYENDGNSSQSVQGNWLKARLALSQAPWKVVAMASLLSWPFQQWGASMVLSSGAGYYERINSNGMPIIVNGLGGNPQSGSRSASSGSVLLVQPGTYFGAGILKSLNCSLEYDLISADGVTRDSIILTKPQPCS